MDTYSPADRSALMSRIRSSDTKAEVRLRKVLHRRGFRYRKNVRGLPGTPDIVLPMHRYVIQVRGCFWHAHANCRRAHTPASNTAYWTPKLARNVERDRASDQALVEAGWRLRVVWECEIQSDPGLCAMADDIAKDLSVGSQTR
ncbi:very short patch repair endonuclease [Phenylobacterium sp.]|uniref:very short patch repair endonuclease n=1 Tax=Phenylobacterium sp. TaxID=1871053 RepID=UPI0035621CC6